MSMRRSKWFQPLFAGLLGLIVFGAQWIGGHPAQGLVSLGVLWAFGALLLLGGGRSDALKDLRGEGHDERMRRIHVTAVAIAGNILIVAIVVAFIVAMAQGRDGRPFTWLGALAGVSYLVALFVLRARS